MLVFVIAITLYVYSIRNQTEQLQRYGYSGLFLLSLLANATIILPAPGIALTFGAGTLKELSPLWVGVVAGAGATLGELSGYMAGFSGQAVIERTDVYDRIKPWVKKYGGWAIMVLSAIPNPFFDVAGIAAGMAKMPIQTFLIFTWSGQLIKMTIFALAGKYSIQLLTNFIR